MIKKTIFILFLIACCGFSAAQSPPENWGVGITPVSGHIFMDGTAFSGVSEAEFFVGVFFKDPATNGLRCGGYAKTGQGQNITLTVYGRYEDSLSGIVYQGFGAGDPFLFKVFLPTANCALPLASPRFAEPDGGLIDNKGFFKPDGISKLSALDLEMPSVTYPKLLFCAGDKLIAPSVRSGAPLSFTADRPGLALNANSGIIDVPNSAAGAYRVSFASNAGECLAAGYSDIKIDKTVSGLQREYGTCEDSLALSVSENLVDPQWGDGQKGHKAVFRRSGQMVFTALTQGGCSIRDTFFVQINSKITLQELALQIKPSRCAPSGSVKIGLGNAKHLYSLDGLTFTASDFFSGLPAGTYRLYAKNRQSSCVDVFAFSVPVLMVDMSKMRVEKEDETCERIGSIRFDVRPLEEAGVPAPYDFFMEGKSHGNYPKIDLKAGVYEKIAIKDAEGCVYLYPYPIRIGNEKASCKGNVFYPLQGQTYPICPGKVYSARSGKMVFETDRDMEWDGRQLNGILETDYYTVYCNDGKIQHVTVSLGQ